MPMLMCTALADFALYLEAEKGYSPKTTSAYRYDLGGFMAVLEERGWSGTVEEIDAPTVRAWIVAMKARHLTNRSIARRIHALRSLWRFLLDTDQVTHDPLRKVSVPKYSRPVPQYLHADELRQILEAAQNNRLLSLARRDYALMAVCIFAGLRRSELINLKLGDVNLKHRALRVCGKGLKWRMVPLAEEVVKALRDWLESRPVTPKHDYLFTTFRGNRIHPTRMQRIWENVLGKSGVRQEGVSLHTLRHSAATLLLQSGTCDIVQIQRLLGHSRLDTTAIYLHVEQRDLQESMSAHPLGGVQRGKSWEPNVPAEVEPQGDVAAEPKNVAAVESRAKRWANGRRQRRRAVAHA